MERSTTPGQASAPTSRQFAALQGLPPDRPVHILNLLRFVDDGERYAEYLRLAQPLVTEVGGSLSFKAEVGTVVIGPEEQEWHRAMIVTYPSKAAFFELAARPEFRALAEKRDNALAAFQLIALIGD